MPRCPICREEISSKDNDHVKSKHPQYFADLEKWFKASRIFLVPGVVATILAILVVSAGLMHAVEASLVSVALTDMLFVLVPISAIGIVYVVYGYRKLVKKYRVKILELNYGP